LEPKGNGYPKAGDGEWSRTGWSPRFGDGSGNPNGIGTALDELDVDKATWLEGRLEDKFFGGLSFSPAYHATRNCAEEYM
jgi:hypothetical protein